MRQNQGRTLESDHINYLAASIFSTLVYLPSNRVGLPGSLLL